MSSWKIIASILSLVDKLSDWLHDRSIRKNERKLVEKEINDEIIEDMGLAKRVRDELGTDNGVRKKYTREE